MRILEVTHYTPPHVGGIERVVAQLVEGLSRRGHEIRWIASAAPKRPGRKDSVVRVPAWNLLEEKLGIAAADGLAVVEAMTGVTAALRSGRQI